MAYLADTNVIARWALPDDPLHALALAAAVSLHRQGENIYIVPQNLTEYWALATRPAEANGLGLSIAQVRTDIRNMEAAFSLLPEAPDLYLHWLNLAETYAVIGRQVYDARLV